jgi:hypothetical protein
MDEPSKQEPDETPASNEKANAGGKPPTNGISATHAEAHTLLSEIRAHHSLAAEKSDHIEQGRLHAEKSRGEIDTHVSAATELLASLKKEIDAVTELRKKANTLNGHAEATSRKAQETKTLAEAALQSMQAMLQTFTENAGVIEGVKVDAVKSQAEIATKSDHIEGALRHADDVRAKLDAAATQAEHSAGATEAQHQASSATNSKLNEIFAAAQAAKAVADSQVEIIAALRQQSEAHAATSKGLADAAEGTEARIVAYETRLKEFEGTAAARLATIESLLPGAASAGLASAFNQRRGHFKIPQRIWQTIFVGSIVALLLLSAGELWFFSQWHALSLTWDQLGLSLLHRLPLALPLIWLAFHASHKAALAQRVEEDYAFKETVSRSFEGFRKEMAELEGKAAPESALSRLCDGVLTIITDPPGRIYEKHHLNATPLNAASESLVPLAQELAKATKITIGLEKPPGTV